MIELGNALLPCVSNHGNKIIEVLQCLPYLYRDNLAHVLASNSGDSELQQFDPALLTEMKDAPWYVQQLAHYTWQSTDSKTTKTIINNSLSELIAANSPFYANKIESMSKTQTYLLIAIANGTKQLTSTKAMQQYKIGTPRNVSKNKAFLINEDIVHEINGKFEFVDPAFEMWFLKEFLNKDYKIR